MNKETVRKINFIIVIMCIVMLLVNPYLVFAQEVDIVEDIETTELQPTDNQFLELRAVSINKIEGKNKQLIMELWGNELEFKRI